MFKKGIGKVSPALVLFCILGLPLDCPGRQLVVSGQEAKSRVQQVNGDIHWHTDLNAALREAARKRKMVLWGHMIGKIDGST